MIDTYGLFSILVACVWTVISTIALYLLYRLIKAVEQQKTTSVLYPSSFRNPSPHAYSTNNTKDADTASSELKRLNELLDIAAAKESATNREQDQTRVEVHADNLCDEVDLSEGAPAVCRKMSASSDKKL